jgi:hypothetical protein
MLSFSKWLHGAGLTLLALSCGVTSTVAQTSAESLSVVPAMAATSTLNYPSRPVTIINPYPAGGGADNLARMIASALTQEWGQSVVVESKPGGGTTIAAGFVAKAKPDGYTLLLSSTQHAIAPLLMKSMSYDYLSSLQAITTLSFTSLYLVVPAKSSADDLNQLIVLLKKNASRMNFASSGSGSLPHLSGELLNLNLNVKVQHIPFQGTSPATNAVLAGEVDFLFADTSAFALIDSKKLKLLAITSEKRDPAFPLVPTLAEVFPGFSSPVWTGLEAPAGTPKAVIDKVYQSSKKVMGFAPIVKFYKESSREAIVLSPSEFTAFKKAEMDKFSQIVKNSRLELTEN